VAANTLLRAEAVRTAESVGVPLFVPPLALSTDNAAMIGAAGFVAYRQGRRAGWNLNAEPNLLLV
jgi:N6-L-threonylcarbamoyladenine synthase